MTRSAARLTLMAQEDLKCELFELKKRLHDTASENYLLKVKVRKLQTEVDKKNKQIECLLDPKKSTNVRKIISERGATMIINLKQRNTDLEQVLLSKDVYIKKLQTVIDTSKVYSTRETLHSFVRNTDHKHTTVQKSYDQGGGNLRSRSLSVTPTPKCSYLKAHSDVQLEYVRLAQNLQKIRLANQWPASETSLKHEEKAEELRSDKSLEATEPDDRLDLDEYLLTMISEMDKMKVTITELSAEQESMKRVLQEKNSNIETLARRVRHLQRRKYKTYSRSPLKQTELEDDKHTQNVATGNLKQDNQTTVPQNNQLQQNVDGKSKEAVGLVKQSTQTYTGDSFDEESGQKTSLSNDLCSTSTSSTSNGLRTNETETNTDNDDDDDVQTGDSIND